VTASAEVTLHVCRVRRRDVASAVRAGRGELRRLRSDPAVSFAKLLGTSGPTFLPTGARPTRWVLLACWRDAAVRRSSMDWRSPWQPVAVESATLRMRPLRSRGAWDGGTAFAPPETSGTAAWSGPTVELTRSAVRLRHAWRFYRTVPAIAAEVARADGLRVAFGIGEAPVLRQGTISIWNSMSAMQTFARDAPAHAAAVRATPNTRWYAEELFVTFALTGGAGTIDGVSVAP
jgi:hypothetical protein